MRVLQLIDSLHSGGAERMCVNIANVLHVNGYVVTLCATRAGGPLEKFISTGVSCKILFKRHSYDFFAFRKLIHIIRDNNIEVVHAHSSSVFWAVAAKLFVKNIKVIWHDHLGIRIYDWKKNFFYKLISPMIDVIIAVNKDLVGWSRMNMKVSPDRIVHINNFPILGEIHKCSNPYFFTVVCLANLRPQKDHETLVRAIDILQKENLPKKLKVIFAGTSQEDEYLVKLKGLINELDLNDIIDLYGSIEDTAALLATADCGVLSSVSEGLPLSLLEYGLAGLPVVVTDVGQCADVIGNGKFGRVVPPGDPDAIAIELSWILKNPNSTTQMGKAFKEHVIKEYGPEQFLKQYEDLLNRLNRK